MEIVFFMLCVFSASFFIAYLHAAHNLKKTTAVLTEIVLLHLSTTDDPQEEVKNIASAEDLHKENFIKFLSDSRDWAYQYIEDVQNAISNFVDEVEPTIEYFDKYGMIVEGSPHHESMKTISNSFKKLKTILPKDSND